jgi:hypothetical protein
VITTSEVQHKQKRLIPTIVESEFNRPADTLSPSTMMNLFVNRSPSRRRLEFAILVFVVSAGAGIAQSNDDRWLRVFTDEDSTVDVDRLSLVLGHDQVITARFRTALANPELVPGESNTGYRIRLDTIQFSIEDRKYRISESILLDASQKVVLSRLSSSSAAWKPIWGRTARRLFNAARQLQPFGTWSVVSYLYASGDSASEHDPPEIRSLVGSQIEFALDRVVMGKEACPAPAFDTDSITGEEFFRRVGGSLKSLGLLSEKADVILLTCRAKINFPAKTIILRLTGSKALMLWDGVFLELERTRNPFLP